MKIQFILPERSIEMPWAGAMRKVLAGDDLSFLSAPTPEADVHVHLWCEGVQPIHNIPCVVFMRRYEFFRTEWELMDWDRVDHVIFVNDAIRGVMESNVPELIGKTSVIYNCFDTDLWTFRERTHGPRIAMVGRVNYRKNIPLALQILDELGEDYHIHVAGEIYQPEIMAYAAARGDNITFHGHIEDIDEWLDDKDYLLHCSISEGNPNAVIQAMAKGIMPVVHAYPGANGQLPRWTLFDTVGEAVHLLSEYTNYQSLACANYARSKFSMGNILKIRDVIANAFNGVTA